MRIEKYQNAINKYELEYKDKPNFNQKSVNNSINKWKQEIYRLELKIKNGNTPLPFTYTETAISKEQSFEMLVTHEMGHYRHYKQIGIDKYFSSISSK